MGQAGAVVRMVVEVDSGQGFVSVKCPAQIDEAREFVRALTNEIAALGQAARAFGKFSERQRQEAEQRARENEEIDRQFRGGK